LTSARSIHPGQLCRTASSARQCDFETVGRHNATCEDSGDLGRFAHHAKASRPWFAVRDNVSATATDANPDFGVSSFDDQLHASLALFQVCALPEP